MCLLTNRTSHLISPKFRFAFEAERLVVLVGAGFSYRSHSGRLTAHGYVFRSVGARKVPSSGEEFLDGAIR